MRRTEDAVTARSFDGHLGRSGRNNRGTPEGFRSASRNLRGFVEDLASRRRRAVVIFEDVHWADEATIDLLKYLSRRIDRTRTLLIITYRDDEIDLDHAIHRLLGDWRANTALRIQLHPLSLDAVRQLAAGRDAEALHKVTGGNPFFVTEVLGSRGESVPITVRDAVLARRATLSVDSRAVLDFVSIVPSRTEFTLLQATLQFSPGAIERCIAAGLLESDAHAVTFRHELARMAVASALPAPRVHSCHRLVFEALLAHFDRSAALARIVHHAEGCGAVDAIIAYAPAAAKQAAALGAHRQAVEHYSRALRCSDRMADEARANLLESFAYEHYVTGDMQAARDAQRDALVVWQRLGTTLAIGRNFRWLSRLAWFAGDREEAEMYADQAIDVLRALPDTEELAMAYSNRSQLDMLSRDLESCVAWGTQAIELARRIQSNDVLAHALNNVGTARANAGDPAGLARLEESLGLALSGDLHEHAARAFTNLGSCEVSAKHYETAATWLQRGIAYTSERDLDAWTSYMQAWRARLHAETGRWAEACADAQAALALPRVPPVNRISALAALGLVHLRRGDPDAREILDEGLTLARPTKEYQRLMPILTARAELAWLTSNPEDLSLAVREGLEVLASDPSSPDRERLMYWLWKSGIDPEFKNGATPYGWLMRGEWQAAAAYWSSKGCPYEYAQALMEGDIAATTRALEIFLTLGATPAVRWAQQRLRQLGARRMPRGRHSSTRAHPAGLTNRESEILAMLSRGLLNPQIAARLFVSRKTVEHHVSSILSKLNVTSRGAAVQKARAHGWTKAEE